MTSNDPLPDAQFEIELKEGEDWGVKLTENLQIMAIRSDGPFGGKCLIGDQIVEVNGTPVRNIEEFEKASIENGPTLQINVVRGLKTACATLLPPEREKNVQRRDGYSYHLTQIDYQRGCKFGLGIKHWQNKVLVSRVDDGSLSAKALVLGDRIVDINGSPVTDKDVARTMLLKSLQKYQTVSMVIERAESSQAKDSITNALHASEMQPPSVAMASDIQDIVKRQKERMHKAKPKTGGIMRPKASSNKQTDAPRRKVSFDNAQKSFVIATDHEGKVLKHIGSGQK